MPINRFNSSQRRNLVFIVLILCVLVIPLSVSALKQETNTVDEFIIVGRLIDSLGRPIVHGDIVAVVKGYEDPLVEGESQEDGTWSLGMHEVPNDDLIIQLSHPHFHDYTIVLGMNERIQLEDDGVYRLGDQQLEREITPAFWVASFTFFLVITLIATERLHSTTAALVGMSTVLIVSYIGVLVVPGLFIFDIETALTYINWEVIFLVLGMMILIAVIENTGVFQWLAFQSYRVSQGRTWLLVLILMAITAIASALLDNFTTMLLMTPISLQIALALGINPLALIIPEVLASNVGGISTLVGTPTNIIIGAYAGISFTDFLVYQTGGVILALIGMGIFVLFYYRKQFKKHSAKLSPALYEKLKENSQIKDLTSLWKAGVVFLIVVIGFVLGESLHMPPAVPAITGATLVLVWLKPDIHKMIKSVDWTTLVFFMALFILVGSIQEVGLLSIAASWMSHLIGDNLTLGIFIIVFGVGTLSTLIANIPLTASLLPIVNYLTITIPGAQNMVLFYALSMGAAMGGNGFLIGAEANLVTAGITAQTDTPITFKAFLKIGLPVTYITLAIGFLWLLYRF